MAESIVNKSRTTISEANEAKSADNFLLLVDGGLLDQHGQVLLVEQARVVFLRLLLVVVVLVVVAVVDFVHRLALHMMLGR